MDDLIQKVDLSVKTAVASASDTVSLLQPSPRVRPAHIPAAETNGSVSEQPSAAAHVHAHRAVNIFLLLGRVQKTESQGPQYCAQACVLQTSAIWYMFAKACRVLLLDRADLCKTGRHSLFADTMLLRCGRSWAPWVLYSCLL